MKQLQTTDIKLVSGGLTVNEIRNDLRIAFPVLGTIAGFIFADIFELNSFKKRLTCAGIGALGAFVFTEMAIGSLPITELFAKRGNVVNS